MHGYSVLSGTGLLFRDPPANWWSPHVDPRVWAVCAPRAVRKYSAGEAVHTGVLALMYLILFCASAVSLFDVTFFALLGDQLGTGLAVGHRAAARDERRRPGGGIRNI